MPESPQHDDVAEDFVAAIAANAAAGEFFDTIAQFYRRADLRCINATGRVRYNRGRQSLDRHAIHIGAARDDPLPRSVHELTDLGYTSLETKSRSVSETEPRRDSAGRMARLVIAAVIVAAIVAVAIDNREEVDVGYVVGDASAPIWVVLVVAGIAGVVIGWLIKHRPSRH